MAKKTRQDYIEAAKRELKTEFIKTLESTALPPGEQRELDAWATLSAKKAAKSLEDMVKAGFLPSQQMAMNAMTEMAVASIAAKLCAAMDIEPEYLPNFLSKIEQSMIPKDIAQTLQAHEMAHLVGSQRRHLRKEGCDQLRRKMGDPTDLTIAPQDYTTLCYDNGQLSLSVSEILAFNYAIFKGFQPHEIHQLVQKKFGWGAVIARADALQGSIVPEDEVQAKEKPKPAEKIVVLATNDMLQAEDIISRFHANAGKEDLDLLHKWAYAMLIEEIAYARGNGAGALLTPATLLRAEAFATRLPFKDEGITTKNMKTVQQIIAPADKPEQILGKCGVLLCAHGAVRREDAKKYALDKVRAYMSYDKSNNRLHWQALSGISKTNAAIIASASQNKYELPVLETVMGR